MEIKYGLITGTGIADFEGLEKVEEKAMDTKYGTPSSPVQIGKIGEAHIAYIMRHGKEKNIPPHMVNHSECPTSIYQLPKKQPINNAMEMKVRCLADSF